MALGFQWSMHGFNHNQSGDTNFNDIKPSKDEMLKDSVKEYMDPFSEQLCIQMDRRTKE